MADPPERWKELGFAVDDACVSLGGVRVELGAPGQGITAWRLRGIDPIEAIDGLPTEVVDRPPTQVGDSHPADIGARHPNGAVGLDHVVVITPDFARTVTSLADAGLPLRRVLTRADGSRLGFRRLGPAILELVHPLDADRRSGVADPGPPADAEPRPPDADPGPPDADPGPARFWGLVVIVSDLDALAARLGAQLGPIKEAVQPGRLIATLRGSAGLGEAVAFMSPEP